MRSIFRFSFCVSLVLAAASLAAAQDAMPWAKSIEEAQQLAAQQNRLVLVHFWSYDCPPCKKLEQNVFPNASFCRSVTANYVPVKINAKDNPELAKRYKVDRWPVDVIITPTGEQLTKATVCPQDANKYLASLDQVAATHRVQAHPATQLANAPAAAYAERPVDFTQPVDNRAPAADPYAGRTATKPATGPQGPGTAGTPWTQGGPSPAPYGAANADPRNAAAPQPQRGAYDANAYPPRENVNMKSAFRPEASPGAAYVEGTPYRDPRADAARAGQYDPRAAQPGPDMAMPPVEVGRASHGDGSAPMYGLPGAPTAQGMAGVIANGQSGSMPSQPGAPTANPYADPRAAQSQYGSQDMQRRDVRLNDQPQYGAGPQQPAVHQPLNEARPQFQENPMVQPKVAAEMGPRGGAPVGPTAMPADAPPLGMDGFCPVALTEASKWSKGDVRFGAIHRGRTYLFSSAADQQKFLGNPDKYSPMLSGYDAVKFIEEGRMVDGKRQHGIVHENHMYLFADEASLDRFCKQPQAYTNSVRQAMQQNNTKTRR